MHALALPAPAFGLCLPRGVTDRPWMADMRPRHDGARDGADQSHVPPAAPAALQAAAQCTECMKGPWRAKGLCTAGRAAPAWRAVTRTLLVDTCAPAAQRSRSRGGQWRWASTDGSWTPRPPPAIRCLALFLLLVAGAVTALPLPAGGRAQSPLVLALTILGLPRTTAAPGAMTAPRPAAVGQPAPGRRILGASPGQNSR